MERPRAIHAVALPARLAAAQAGTTPVITAVVPPAADPVSFKQVGLCRRRAMSRPNGRTAHGESPG
ncbi:PE domain-containing protein [Mycobacterium simulans]|uniref:PE domain-containing protein n=1 Tax=Mycobacterium simulans TaxID=627089 RepID=UPI00163F3C06|nr:PE domain-containing protein [Mycobacterium simulans]